LRSLGLDIFILNTFPSIYAHLWGLQQIIRRKKKRKKIVSSSFKCVF